MNDLTVTDTKKVFNNVENNLSRDISDNLLMAKLLGQHSKEDHSDEMKEQAEKKISTEFVSTNSDNSVPKFNMWHSVGPINKQKNEISYLNEDESIHRTHSEEFINERPENVYELLSQSQSENPEITSKKFLAMSSSPEGCLVLRQSGYLPAIIQLIHGSTTTPTVREQASQALHLIVQHNTDEKLGRREGHILNLIEQLLEYCDRGEHCVAESPLAPVTALMKLSYDIDQRHTMCQFGALYALSKLIQFEHARMQYDVSSLSDEDIRLRRFAAMSLTNLSCGDCANKELLSSIEPFMFAIVAQLQSPNEELCNITGSVLRNVSWRANVQTQKMLEHVDAASMLMKTLMRMNRESSLTSLSSAVWNLSAHSDKNKEAICNVDHAIEFLVKMLTYQAPSGCLHVVHSMGGILRNISRQIAIQDDYRAILRRLNGLPLLLQQLKSPSLMVVNNASGTLWNLTARCAEDQCTLIQLGAVDMLRSLTHSKHRPISMSSTAALKNLMSCSVSHSILEACRTNSSSERKRFREHCPSPTSPESGSVRSVEVDPHENDGNQRTNDQVSDVDEDKSNSFRKVEEPYNDDGYNDYTETDLDEPTNYSLKFSEHVIESAATIHTPPISETEVSERKMPPSNEKAPLETPLMFSRSSSIDSISTCGEPIDDQGSVVSEFSRAVSGIVTPSELPDSPSQTVPPTPQPQTLNKTNMFPIVASKDMFEDEVTVFKDECTPTMFSVATSLSSLSFDDDSPVLESRIPENKFDHTYAIKTTPEPSYSDQSKLDRSYIVENELDHTYVVDSQSETTSANRTTSPISLTLMVSDDDKDDSLEVEVDLSLEEQQAILEACIVSGKPSSVPRVNGGNTDIVDKIASENVTTSNGMMRENVNHPSFPSISLIESTVNYCTEDTPICISHAASNSDLSLLCPSEDSFLQNSILPLSSCLDSDDLLLPNDEEENLLNQCIAIGKQSLNCNSNLNSLEENKSSQSSTLSEITEDLPIEDRTLIKDMTAEANLISSMLTASSITDSVDGILDDDVSRDLSEEEEKALLNQCIAMGMQSMKDSSDLDNIGPPSFLAEANLDSSLTNVEEITDYPPNPVKLTPNQKRRQIKERYNTYTLKQQSPTKALSLTLSKDEETNDSLAKESSSVEERRIIEKDRFKTRIISKDDFEEIIKCQNKEKPIDLKKDVEVPTPTASQLPLVSSLHKSDESSTTSENEESFHERVVAKIVKPVVTPKTVKSGIPVVNSKIPKTKSSTPAKRLPPSELPVNLLRQNTFTKEESSSIPIRKDAGLRAVNNSLSKPTTPTLEVAETGSASSPSFKSGIPSRISSVPKTGGKVSDMKSPDMVKNHRWSMSENNLNASSTFKGGSSTSLDSSSTFSTTPHPLKGNPSASQSALPVRRESNVRNNIAYYAYK